MKQIVFPSYQELDLALGKTKLKLHPSQVHGLICGILCGNANQKADWETLVTGGEKESKSVHQTLEALFTATQQQLSEFLFELQMILPVDEVELPIRAEALTLWCQGMLTGLKISQVPIVDREPSELTEAINDFIEIAKMNYEDVVANEEDEVAYTELVEYVRMAVILVYQELQGGAASLSAANSTNRLH
jgi:uncharacterized protein YgfB (UPF0149 family)